MPPLGANDALPSSSWLGIRTHPRMTWLLCRVPHQEGREPTAEVVSSRPGRCLCSPTYQFPGYLFRNTWNSYPKPLDPISYGQYSRVSPSHQLLPRVLMTRTGRVSRPVDHGPGPSRMLLLSSKRSEAPLRLSPAEGTTPGHKPPEAFCHLPELLRARES